MIDVDRHISFYGKQNDEFVGQILINEIELPMLLKVITESTYKDDDLLYGCYLLSEEQLNALSEVRNNKIEYDFSKYEYFLEATGK